MMEQLSSLGRESGAADGGQQDGVQWRTVILYLHLLAAIFWIGEMLFLALVAGPYARTLEPRQRSALFQALGQRSRPFAWGAVGVLLVTGMLNVHFMGIPLADLVQPQFYSTGLGAVLGPKLASVLVLLCGVGYHDVFLVRKRAGLMRRLETEGPQPDITRALERSRRKASWAGRFNLILALLVAWFGVSLVTGL